LTLDDWKDRGVISPSQHARLSGLSRREPFSVFLELNLLLYAGVASFVAGLAWTVQSYSRELGDAVVLTVLSGILAGCLWYCFTRAQAWSPAQTPPPSLVFDYVVYLGCLTWSVELGYLESRLHLLSGQWDIYLLATACFFFALAYRFDNRLVLSLALSALAGWFGIRIQLWQYSSEAAYRTLAILYSVATGAAGILLQRLSIKPHFFLTYLNLAANVFFVALLSGVFHREGYALWFLLLLAACGCSLAYGLTRKQFSFVAYAAVYGYIGVSSVLIRGIHDSKAALTYFVVTGILMLVLLAGIARRFGREA
jgi:hypothetical protein